MLPLNESYDTFDKEGRRIAADSTGKVYVKIAETVPNQELQDPGSKQQRENIFAQKPEHYSSTRPGFTGYWIPQEEETPAEPAPAGDQGQGDQGQGPTEPPPAA